MAQTDITPSVCSLKTRLILRQVLREVVISFSQSIPKYLSTILPGMP